MGVFLPGHTRGRITAGPAPVSQVADSCCSSHSSDPEKPTQSDRQRCAVCFIVNGILPTTPVIFDAKPLEDLSQFVRIESAQVDSLELPTPAGCRDPPADFA